MAGTNAYLQIIKKLTAVRHKSVIYENFPAWLFVSLITKTCFSFGPHGRLSIYLRSPHSGRGFPRDTRGSHRLRDSESRRAGPWPRARIPACSMRIAGRAAPRTLLERGEALFPRSVL